MSGSIDTALIGAGPHARALLSHGAPFGRVRLASFSAVPGEAEAELAGLTPCAPRPWQEAVADPALPAVLVFGPAGQCDAVVAAALAHGKTVLCPPPVAATSAALAALQAAQRRGGGRLLTGGEIAHSAAGRHGLAAIRAPGFGSLRTLFVALRQPRGGDGDVLEALGWEALDLVLEVVGEDFARPRVNAGALFGGRRDTAVILLRTVSGVVVTIELARCLPASIPAPGLGEIEIEAIGTGQSVRILPQASAVQVFRDDGRRSAPWMDAPALGMLAALQAGFDTPGSTACGVQRALRMAALMQAIRDAADAA